MELITLTAFIIGVIVGAVVTWFYLYQFHDASLKAELESNLEQTHQQFDEYRSEVNAHFVKTSELVNNLTDSYKEVHEYLANSAMHLSNLEITRDMIEASNNDDIELKADIAAPKDYAPKKTPNEVGTLSEEFGLDKPEQDVTEPKSQNQ